MNEKKLEWDFGYHKPETTEKENQHELIRSQCLFLARQINDLLPDCREKSLAITKLEEVVFWSNAAIARNPRPEDSV